jgi:hypothetical protein
VDWAAIVKFVIKVLLLIAFVTAIVAGLGTFIGTGASAARTMQLIQTSPYGDIWQPVTIFSAFADAVVPGGAPVVSAFFGIFAAAVTAWCTYRVWCWLKEILT